MDDALPPLIRAAAAAAYRAAGVRGLPVHFMISPGVLLLRHPGGAGISKPTSPFGVELSWVTARLRATYAPGVWGSHEGLSARRASLRNT